MSHHEGNDGNNDYDEGAKDNQIESAAKELESEESQTESDLGANVKKQHASSDPNDIQQCLSDDSSIDSQNGHRDKEPLNDKQNPDVSPPSPQTATHTSKDLATNSGEQNVLHIVDNLVNATDSSTPKKVDLCTGCYKETARTLCIQCNLWLGNQCLGRHQTRKDALTHTVLQREAVQICPSHSRPCSHFCVDCQRVVCPACALENCSSHTTQDISWSLDEMRLFLVHKRGLVDKYFQYIRQKQNMVFDDAKRAVIFQTGTLISTLLRRSRALEEELESARVKSLSLLGRQEDAYNAMLQRFFAAMPQTPGDGIPAELLDLLPVVKVIPETSITAAMFEPCESLNLGHLDITRQARDSIMLTKLPKHPCCEVIKTPPYPLESGMLPHHQAGTMVAVSGSWDEANQCVATHSEMQNVVVPESWDEGNRCIATQTEAQQNMGCDAAVQTVKKKKTETKKKAPKSSTFSNINKSYNDSNPTPQFNTPSVSKLYSKPEGLPIDSTIPKTPQKGICFKPFQNGKKSQNAAGVLFSTSQETRQSQNGIFPLVGKHSVTKKSENDSISCSLGTTSTSLVESVASNTSGFLVVKATPITSGFSFGNGTSTTSNFLFGRETTISSGFSFGNGSRISKSQNESEKGSSQSNKVTSLPVGSSAVAKTPCSLFESVTGTTSSGLFLSTTPIASNSLFGSAKPNFSGSLAPVTSSSSFGGATSTTRNSLSGSVASTTSSSLLGSARPTVSSLFGNGTLTSSSNVLGVPTSTTSSSSFVSTNTTSSSLFGSATSTTSSTLSASVALTTRGFSLGGAAPTTSSSLFGSATSNTSSFSFEGTTLTTSSFSFGVVTSTTNEFLSPGSVTPTTSSSLFGNVTSTTSSSSSGSVTPVTSSN